jgi:2-polyprenyl-6-hydroxyphenyl methylase/3-demethylubiquinone-9 3-methyltransferase
MPKQQSNQNSTIDVEEVERFSALFNEWWDGNGKLKTLHDINPIRIKYIKEVVIKHFKIKDSIQVFGNLKIIDIGCGGGLLSVPMNKLGAKVTGIDPSKESIKIAKHYAKENKLAIDFQCTDTKDAAKKHKGTFDVVLNMEVVEHVADVEKFLEESSHLAKQMG